MYTMLILYKYRVLKYEKKHILFRLIRLIKSDKKNLAAKQITK